MKRLSHPSSHLIFGSLAVVMGFMPNAIHIVVPGGGHTPENDCTRSIRRQLFRTGTIQGLDTSCMAQVQPVPFKLPGKSAAAKGTP
jgi:hypothetical protein